MFRVSHRSCTILETTPGWQRSIARRIVGFPTPASMEPRSLLRIRRRSSRDDPRTSEMYRLVHARRSCKARDTIPDSQCASAPTLCSSVVALSGVDAHASPFSDTFFLKGSWLPWYASLCWILFAAIVRFVAFRTTLDAFDGPRRQPENVSLFRQALRARKIRHEQKLWKAIVLFSRADGVLRPCWNCGEKCTSGEKRPGQCRL